MAGEKITQYPFRRSLTQTTIPVGRDHHVFSKFRHGRKQAPEWSRIGASSLPSIVVLAFYLLISQLFRLLSLEFFCVSFHDVA
jgi:hypothetical protein